jgi:hypothetical protein
MLDKEKALVRPSHIKSSGWQSLGLSFVPSFSSSGFRWLAKELVVARPLRARAHFARRLTLRKHLQRPPRNPLSPPMSASARATWPWRGPASPQ